MQAAWRRALTVVCVAALLVGCSTSQRTLTLPAEEPSLNVGTDSITLNELPPADLDVTRTEPLRVTKYDSTRGPSADMRRVQVSSNVITLLLADGTQLEYNAESYGETFQWVATGDSTGQAGVSGKPKEETRTVSEERLANAQPWWVRWWRSVEYHLAVIGAVAVLGIVAFFASRIFNPFGLFS